MIPLINKDKNKILEKLNEQYGIKNLPYLLIKFGENKLRIYSGNLSKEELSKLDKNLRIENIGLYFAKIEKENNIRLTFDGVSLLKEEITKNILIINKEQENDWLKGNNLEIKSEKNWKIIKYEDDFLGCGKSTGEKITNFIPKERRIKN
ncbi:MAG: hypothetical protein QXW97_02495 [Candidatus Pacearchaeota archaeon]